MSTALRIGVTADGHRYGINWAEGDRSLDFEARGNPSAYACTRCGAPCGCRERTSGHCTDCVLYLRGSALRPTDPREWERNARLAAVGAA